MTVLIFFISALIIYFSLPPYWCILLGLLISFILPPSPLVQKYGKKWSARLLQASIVLLGAALNFQSVLKEGSQGIIITAISISTVFALGFVLAKLFKVTAPLSTLITTGTSICGGSAIAAISPIIKASSLSMATSLAIVFLLNTVAVFIFPTLGHFFQLSQEQFGVWAALAIHDTSSVVAASQIYGDEALKIGTTLKLTRALWIIPLSLIFAGITKSKNKITIPWFIFLFLLMSLTFTLFTDLNFLLPYFSKASKMGLSLTLFLLGLGINKEQMKTIGVRPILFALSLWVITSIGSLVLVKYL